MMSHKIVSLMSHDITMLTLSEKFKEERSTQQKRETKSDGVEQMDTSTFPSR